MYYIYRITCNINNKTYIGQRKWNKDISADKYMGSGVLIKKAQKKYGIDNFVKEILHKDINNKADVNLLEIYYIKLEKSKNKGEYNLTNGGEGNGHKHSQETKNKISKSLINNKRASGKNLNNTNAKGNILTEETKLKMSQSKIGNTNNGEVYIECIQTGEVLRVREWIKRGFKNVHLVAKGIRKSCNKLNFVFYKQ